MMALAFSRSFWMSVTNSLMKSFNPSRRAPCGEVGVAIGCLVQRFVELHAEMLQPQAREAPNGLAVLADSSREDQQIDATHRRRHRRHLGPQAVHVHVEGHGCPFVPI